MLLQEENSIVVVFLAAYSSKLWQTIFDYVIWRYLILFVIFIIATETLQYCSYYSSKIFLQIKVAYLCVITIAGIVLFEWVYV